MKTLLIAITVAVIVTIGIGVGLDSVAFAQPAPPAGAPQPTADPLDAARKACTDTMNADPAFAKSILATVDKQLDAQTLAAHEEAQEHIRRNEKSVVLAYAALWIVAALFVVFVWRRQVALRAEIEQLRTDLDRATKEGSK